LELLGDKWTLLILRDMVLAGKSSFLEWKASDEKIAPSVLTSRVNLLLKEGLVVKKTSDRNASKFLYYLTEKGIKVIPLLVDLLEFGANFVPAEQAQANLRKLKKDRAGLIRQLQEKMRTERIEALGS
jgi:DNA-binding HxlR family transcriptional regulator